MKKCSKFLMYILIFGFLCNRAIAEPEVIADLGGTETGWVPPQIRLKQIAKDQPIPQLIKRNVREQRFPIRSEMQVGIVHPHANDKQVPRPFFIIGTDEYSTEWLKANHEYLKQINARGLITNVDSSNDIDALRSLVNGIPIDAMPVDAIAETFELNYYPVLVLQEEITQ